MTSVEQHHDTPLGRRQQLSDRRPAHTARGESRRCRRHRAGEEQHVFIRRALGAVTGEEHDRDIIRTHRRQAAQRAADRIRCRRFVRQDDRMRVRERLAGTGELLERRRDAARISDRVGQLKSRF